jgi:hypothetical protein
VLLVQVFLRPGMAFSNGVATALTGALVVSVLSGTLTGTQLLVDCWKRARGGERCGPVGGSIGWCMRGCLKFAT